MKGIFRRGNWFITLPLAVIGLGYLYFFFLPAKRDILKLRVELETRKAEIERSRPLKATVFDRETQLRATEEYVEQWKRTNDDDAASVLALISQVTQDAGVQTIRFDPQPTVKLKSLTQTPLHLGTTGSFASLFALMQRLESLPARVRIERLTLRAPAKPGNSLESEVNLVISTVNPNISD